MKWNSRRVSAWAYAAPADLRKGFDGLSALVRNELSCDPLSGDLYLFVSRNRIRAKVLHWDSCGVPCYVE
jgi:transposase